MGGVLCFGCDVVWIRFGGLVSFGFGFGVC